MNMLSTIKNEQQDFEWYPTTNEMIAVVRSQIPEKAESIMDIGAGDGRVLLALSDKCEMAKLFSIEKSFVLVQSQDPKIIPVGTDFWEQNISALPAQYIFSNPPYSEYENWTERIISECYARDAFLIIPQRWKESALIASALKRREATAKVVYEGDFLNGDRKSRAKIDIVRVTFKKRSDYGRDWKDCVVDPFDQWFDDNIDMFDKVKPENDPDERTTDKEKLNLKLRGSDADEMVEAYLADLEHLQNNYRLIFQLDGDLLRELGVEKSTVREGLKKKIRELKIAYWGILFDRLKAITDRLTTKSRKILLERLVENNTIDFTSKNIRAIALWAINNVNGFVDQQLVDLFKELATHDGATNYKSNERTWVKQYWRYNVEDHSHFALDYRIIRHGGHAIYDNGWYQFEYPGNLHNDCHNLIADMIAVFTNLGFTVSDLHSKSRHWTRGKWEDFTDLSGKTIFQVKGYQNGNLHIRVYPKAMQALNIKAAQILKWVGSIEEVVEEIGYDKPTAEKYFNYSQYVTMNNLPLLQSSSKPVQEQAQLPQGDFKQQEMEF